ncbi:MAG: AraC family transcriptional regulator, partial [Algicola sp.]|nr:AraC family transcriptional regulator [Algicola sp.]
DVTFLAAQLCMSSRQLNRKMKSLFDLTPIESIRSFRLKKAAEQLRKGYSPSLVFQQVGFSSHSYFSQCFKARFNCMPSDYC